MEYRDERDALHARLENLEIELASARAENERMRATENAFAALQRENEVLRSQLGRPASSPRRSWLPLFVVGMAVAVFIVAGAVFALMGAPAPAPPSVVVTPKVEPIPTSEPVVVQPPPRSARSVTAEWKARVVKSDGLPFAADTPCTLRATLTGDGVETNQPVVSIACAGKALYNAGDALNGMSNLSYGVEEVPGESAGSYRYALSYQDQGPRTGERTQASTSTLDHVATAWSDTAPRYRVELAVDELSSPWNGAPLVAQNEESVVPFRQVVKRSGRVTEANGNGLVRVGDACEVTLRPAFGGSDRCRVWVRCGAATLYGAGSGGFASCEVEGGKPFSAKDTSPSSDDKDAVLEVWLGRGTARVSDDTPNTWNVGIALSP